MKHSRMMQRVLLTVIATTLALSTAATQAGHLTVAELIAEDGEVLSGDKLFTNFGYVAAGEMPPADRVSVLPITDVHGNFGIRFAGPFTDGPDNGGSDALITYDVTVTDPGQWINDAHISANLEAGNGTISIAESFFGATDMLQLSINPNQRSDWGDFDSLQKSVRVEKNIFAFSFPNGPGGMFNLPTMSFVDQTFSQVPEPTTLVLGFVGIVGLGLMRRRQA